MRSLAYPVGFVPREGVSTVNHYGGFTRMEHESEALVTQASGDDLDAALARTVRLFIWTASKPDEPSPPSGG
jgi:hypothetical protein